MHPSTHPSIHATTQGTISAIPIYLGQGLLHLSPSQVGAFLGLASLAVLPINLVTAVAATWGVSDRNLAAAGQLGCLAACGLLAALPTPEASSLGTSVGLYIAGVMLIICFTMLLEATAMSLTARFASGLRGRLFGEGLLTTEAGTSGRLLGNLAVTALGDLVRLEATAPLGRLMVFTRSLDGAFGLITLGCLALTLHIWPLLKD